MSPAARNAKAPSHVAWEKGTFAQIFVWTAVYLGSKESCFVSQKLKWARGSHDSVADESLQLQIVSLLAGALQAQELSEPMPGKLLSPHGMSV